MTTTVEVASREIIRRRYEKACQELGNLRTKKDGLVDIKHISREEDAWFYVGKGEFYRRLDKIENEFPTFSFRQFMFTPPYCGMWEGTAKRLVELHEKNENASVYFAGTLSETGHLWAAPDIYFGPQSILHINNLDPTSKALTIIYDNELIARSVGNLPIPRTEIYWKKDKNEITLEAERIHDINKANMGYLTKYFHAMFPLTSNTFKHFDGSIKEYNPQEFQLREAITIDRSGKSSKKVKLFRVDGIIEGRDSVGIFAEFFKNPLVWKIFFNEPFELIKDYDDFSE